MRMDFEAMGLSDREAATVVLALGLYGRLREVAIMLMGNANNADLVTDSRELEALRWKFRSEDF